MKQSILPALIFFASVFAVSCDSCDDDEPTLPEFTGISRTDDNGQPLSSLDESDWRTDGAWQQEEKDLFDFTELPLCNGDGEVSPAYPNPCSSVLNFRFVSSADELAYLRVVDKDFNILLKADSIPFQAGVKNIALNFSAFEPGTLRLYYRIVGDGCEYRGHGDVIVQ